MLQGRDAEFAALNKQLRACFVCKLIKAHSQVRGIHQAQPCIPQLWCNLCNRAPLPAVAGSSGA
jgi:hypothetical protein